MEQGRSSITDDLGNDKDAFMAEFMRSQQHKHHEEQQQTTSIKIPSPGDPSAYFAPISPAAKTESVSGPGSAANSAPGGINPLMEMLRSGGKSK